MVDRIEDVDGSYPSNSHNGSARLPLEEISIGLGQNPDRSRRALSSGVRSEK